MYSRRNFYDRLSTWVWNYPLPGYQKPL